MHTQTNTVKDKMPLRDAGYASVLPIYPIDISLSLTIGQSALDTSTEPLQSHSAGDHPTNVAQYALAQWNQYIATNIFFHRHEFLIHAHWLIEHLVHIGKDAGGWPISSSHPDKHIRSPWLSSLTQGCGISVLTRAYLLTGEETFLEAAQRVVRTFERDILDGGFNTPIGKEGVFFE